MWALDTKKSFSDKVPDWFDKWPAREQKRYLDLGEYPNRYQWTNTDKFNTWIITSGIGKLFQNENHPYGHIKINNEPLNNKTIKSLYGVIVEYFKNWPNNANSIQYYHSITPTTGKYKWKKLLVEKVDWWYELYISSQ